MRRSGLACIERGRDQVSMVGLACRCLCGQPACCSSVVSVLSIILLRKDSAADARQDASRQPASQPDIPHTP